MSAGKRAIVIGSGASGASAAFRLKQAGMTVRMVERDARVGGRMRTEHINGHVVDIGAGLMPGTYKAVQRLMQDAKLGHLLDQLKSPTAIMRDRRMHYIEPGSPMTSMVTTKLLSAGAKLSLLKLPLKLIPMWNRLGFENLGESGPDDVESVSDYVRRELNEEALEYLLGPVVKTMYSASPSDMSVLDLFWCLRNLMDSNAYCLRGGMDRMSAGIAEGLDDVSLETECIGVEERGPQVAVTLRDKHGVESEDIADVCVIAVRSCDINAIHHGLSSESRQCIDKLRYSATTEIHLMLNGVTDEKAAVVMIPDSEDPDIATISFVHNRGTERCPPGKGAVSVYFHERWASEVKHLPDDKVYELGMQKAERLLPGLSAMVEGFYLQRWDFVATKTHPGYWKNVGHLVKTLDTKSRVQLAGDYFALACINTAVTSGETAAQRLIRNYS